MHRVLLAAALTITGFVQAPAQSRFGVRVGYNAAWFAGQVSFEPPQTYRPEHGVQAGLTYQHAFGRVAVQPALLFTHQGSRARQRSEYASTQGPYIREYEQRFRLNYVALQLPGGGGVVYTSGADHGWQLFAGPYVARGASGKFEGHYAATLNGNPADSFGGTSGVRFANDGSSYYTSVRPWDAGLLGGIGYLRGPVQVQAGYSHGLLNRVTDAARGSSDWHERQRTAFLTATYFFGSNPS